MCCDVLNHFKPSKGTNNHLFIWFSNFWKLKIHIFLAMWFTMVKQSLTIVIYFIFLTETIFSMARIGLAKMIYKSETPSSHRLQILWGENRFHQGKLEHKTSHLTNINLLWWKQSSCGKTSAHCGEFQNRTSCFKQTSIRYGETNLAKVIIS